MVFFFLSLSLFLLLNFLFFLFKGGPLLGFILIPAIHPSWTKTLESEYLWIFPRLMARGQRCDLSPDFGF